MERNIILLAAVALAISFFICAFIKRYALQLNLIDVPNDRSSHTLPTPRGGGMGIVFAIFVCDLLWYLSYGALPELFWMVSIPTYFVAIVGFFDDFIDLTPKTRLLVHFSAAIAVIVMIPQIVLFGLDNQIVLILFSVAGVFCLVWFINLYNFMDGINGIAVGEALTVFSSIAFFYYLGGHDSLFQMAIIVCFASLGFMVWNFPRARLFMGDGGSGFLGIFIGAVAFYSLSIDPRYFWIMFIMMSVFITDSTFTLLKRGLQGKPVLKAHNEHAYQQISRNLESHAKTTSLVLAFNILWLFPLCFVYFQEQIPLLIALVAAYAPLLLIAVRYSGKVRHA